jgi:hypothetical protein
MTADLKLRFHKLVHGDPGYMSQMCVRDDGQWLNRKDAEALARRVIAAEKLAEAWRVINQYPGIVVSCDGYEAANTWKAFCAAFAEFEALK